MDGAKEVVWAFLVNHETIVAGLLVTVAGWATVRNFYARLDLIAERLDTIIRLLISTERGQERIEKHVAAIEQRSK